MVILPPIQSSLGGEASPNSDYNFDQYIYPDGLDVSSMPYMAIRINILQGSQFYDSANTTTANRGTASLITGANAGTGTLIAAGAIAGAIAGGAAGALTSVYGGKIQALGTVARGAAAGGGAAAIGGVTTKGTAGSGNPITGRYRRLKSEIILYMPNDVAFDYGVSWQQSDTDDFNIIMQNIGGAIRGGKEVASILDKATSGMTAISALIDYIKSSAPTSTGAATLGAIAYRAAGAGFSAATNTAYNTHEEQIFKNVEFRTFNFSWTFAPRSTQEAKKCLDIIQLLRFHAAPEYNTPEQFTYIYPSQFELRFFVGGVENTKIPKIATCVLTKVSVNYTPNEVYAMLSDGTAPVIKLSTSFAEIILHTKETISLGY